MDYKNSESNEEKSELKDLLEVSLLQAQLSTPEKVETDNDPWLLQEENHLANLELDYAEQKGDIKPLTPGKETAAEKNIRNKKGTDMIKNNSVKPAKNLDIKMKDERKMPA